MTLVRPDPIAAHEAGHAVMAVHHGIPVDRVRVGGLEHYRGITSFAPGRWRSKIVAGLIYAAGPAADTLAGFAPPSARRRAPDAWYYDLQAIARLGFRPADRDYLIAAACQILQGPCAQAWARVRAALLVQDLDGEQVRGAFEGPVDLD